MTDPRQISLGGQKVLLLRGEEVLPISTTVLKTARIFYDCPYTGRRLGRLMLTNFRLYFCTDGTEYSTIVDIFLGCISHIEFSSSQRAGAEKSYIMDLICKDVRNVRFDLQCSDCKRFFEELQAYAFPQSKPERALKMPAFNLQEQFDVDGWKVYDALTEFNRMKLPTTWTVTNINKDYALCDTYPAVLAVPASVPDSTLRTVAEFRSRNRIPVLSWIHPENQASLTRCAQPNVGVNGRRSQEDECYLKVIQELNVNKEKLLIVDARPHVNAMANRMRGGGTENESNYGFCQLYFFDIPNIHSIRSSMQKLRDFCYPLLDDEKFLTRVDNTEWLKWIKYILLAATEVAKQMEDMKMSVLVHCSDGWDRTAQVTGLAMLMLDPYYRTMDGFEVLIEKEWCSFGHKFAARVGHGHDCHADSELSPVFLQFIDCVWQMIVQFPHHFEFNESFLICILDHLYSCVFGTFLENCERERLPLRSTTHSLWSYTNSWRDDYLNPLYVDSRNRDHRPILYPSFSIKRLRLWTNYYVRWNPRLLCPEPMVHRMQQMLRIRRLLEKKKQEMEAETKALAKYAPTA